MAVPPYERLAGVSGLVQRVDGPRPGWLALTLRRRPEPRVLLLSTGPPRPGIGLVERRPRGAAADGFVQALRRRLEGAAWTGLEPAPGGWALLFERGDRVLVLRLVAAAGRRGLWLEEGGRVVAARGLGRVGAAPPGGEDWPARPLPEDLAAAGLSLLRNDLEGRRTALRREGRRRLGRLERRLRHLEEDVARAEEAPHLRRLGELLLSGAPRPGKDEGHVVVTDWYADPPVEREVAIDPRRGVQGTAQKCFERARKLERGREVARERRVRTEAEHARWTRWLRRLEGAETVEELERLAEEAGLPAPSEPSGRERRATPSRRAWREYLGEGGRPLLVGRDARGNEELTFRRARPHDLWVHVRDAPGSHVIVPLAKGETVPPELLLDAATLAVHFSPLRGEPRAEVRYAHRRYVRPLKGGPPGTVRVDRERTLLLQMEEARLQRLLSSLRGAG